MNYLIPNFRDIAQAICNRSPGYIGKCRSSERRTGNASEQTKYRIQVGLFRNRNNAARQQETLEDRWFPGIYDQWKQYYRVISGEYDMLDRSSGAQRKTKRSGFETLLIQ